VTIGEKIIGECILSLDEAEIVHDSIRDLYDKGSWDTPDWAVELSKHLKVASADVVILFTAWRALAIAYREGGVIRDRKTQSEV